MFRSSCGAFFRLFFEQVKCTIDNAFNLQDLVLKGLVKIIGFVLLTQYCAGDKIEKNEMGWACGAYGCGEGGV